MERNDVVLLFPSMVEEPFVDRDAAAAAGAGIALPGLDATGAGKVEIAGLTAAVAGTAVVAVAAERSDDDPPS